MGDFSTPITSNFRLVGASNRDLRQLVTQNAFREDLLARIAFHTISLPSLRERFCDLPAHAQLALDDWNKKQHTAVVFDPHAKQRYLAFATSPDARWPGNFRELNASVRHMCINAFAGNSSRPRITLAIVNDEISRLDAEWAALAPQSHTPPPSSPISLDALSSVLAPYRANRSLFDALELHLQNLDLERFQANQAAAARFLYEPPQRPLVNPSDTFAKRRARLTSSS